VGGLVSSSINTVLQPWVLVAKELNNRDVCLFALVKCGGDVSHISTEDIALKAFELYPEKFGLIAHPAHPDVDSVRVTLTDLRKAKYGILVEGDKKMGWRTTPEGTAWYKSNKKAIADAIQHKLGGQKRVSSGVMIKGDKVRTFRLTRIKTSEAYKKWKAHSQPNKYDFYNLLRVDTYTSPDVYERHMKDLTDVAEEDDELKTFLRAMDQAYGGEYRK
jgi:hypothetical protein